MTVLLHLSYFGNWISFEKGINKESRMYTLTSSVKVSIYFKSHTFIHY
jgi:hypothetical protein